MLRTYSTSNTTGPTSASVKYWITRSQAPLYTEYLHAYQDFYSFMKGKGIHGYHAKVKAGEFLPYMPWHQFHGRVECEAGWHKVQRTSGYWEQGNGTHSLALVTSIPINEHPDMSDLHYHLQKAAADIYDRGWDGLTFSAELQKTKAMFRKTARSIVNTFRRVEAGKRDRSMDWIRRDNSGFWLEGRYGWRTLVYDMRDLHDAVVNFDNSRSVKTERSGFSYATQASGSSSTSDSDAQYNCTWTEDTEYSLRGSIAAEISTNRVIVNPVLTAWELMPYSFMVDWALDVGTAIKALSFYTSQKRHTACLGYRATRRYEKTMVAVKKAGSTNTVTGPGYRSFAETEQVYRTPSSLSLNPKITNRKIDPSMLTDIAMLWRVKGAISGLRI